MTDQLTRTDDIFLWKGISILQKDDVFKVGTDALLLGAWVPKILHSADNILDIGSGTGVLSLIMHHAFPAARILAIDQEASAVMLSAINFSKSTRPDLLTAMEYDVFSLDTPTKFNLIVCNPPYFFEPSHLHQGPYSRARHAKDNPYTWMQKIASLLTTDGHVCLVLPASVAAGWIRGGNDHRLFVSHRMNVFSFRCDMEPKRVLLQFTPKLCRPILKKMCIYDKEDMYSSEYTNFVAGHQLS